MATDKSDIPLNFRIKEHEALVNVWWTGVQIKQRARHLFKDTPYSEAEFNLLMILKYTPGQLTQNDISQRLLVDKSNVTGLIDRLEKADLIRRNADPTDRRRYLITLTKAGKAEIDRLDPVYHQLVQQIMSELDDREYEALITLTGKVRRGVRDSW